MRWQVLQVLIIAAFAASNVRWEWTESAYLPAIYGGLAAYLVTVGLSKLIDWRRSKADPDSKPWDYDDNEDYEARIRAELGASSVRAKKSPHLRGDESYDDLVDMLDDLLGENSKSPTGR